MLFPHLSLADNKNLQDLIDQKLAHMTPEQKIGQLFIIGFPETNLTPELKKFIHQYHPGSFILFKRNISSLSQIRKLNESLYHESFLISSVPPLIAIDQEGGAVSRLPIEPPPPNAFALGQTQSPLLAEEMGYETGMFLREAGFNMNLAPVLDVVNPYAASFIGERSFGSDPQGVGEMGVAISKGMIKAHVIPTAKHFPGTGSVIADPHRSVVESSSSKDLLMKKDVVPFKAYAALGTPVAVMLSHLIYPALDSSRQPASFSSKISTDLLRGDLEYKGLVITDDLQMKATKLILTPEEAALKALKAGADVVMLTWSLQDQAKAFQRLQKALKRKEITMSEVNRKVRRILTAKAFVNSYKQPATLSPSETVLSSERFSYLENAILEQNLRSHLVPTSLPAKEDERAPASAATLNTQVCVVSPSNEFNDSFKQGISQPVPALQMKAASTAAQVTAWGQKNHCDHYIFAVTGFKTSRLIAALPAATKRKSIVANLASPSLLRNEKPYNKVLQLYFPHKEAGKHIAEHIKELLPEGSVASAKRQAASEASTRDVAE